MAPEANEPTPADAPNRSTDSAKNSNASASSAETSPGAAGSDVGEKKQSGERADTSRTSSKDQASAGTTSEAPAATGGTAAAASDGPDKSAPKQGTSDATKEQESQSAARAAPSTGAKSSPKKAPAEKGNKTRAKTAAAGGDSRTGETSTKKALEASNDGKGSATDKAGDKSAAAASSSPSDAKGSRKSAGAGAKSKAAKPARQTPAKAAARGSARRPRAESDDSKTQGADAASRAGGMGASGKRTGSEDSSSVARQKEQPSGQALTRRSDPANDEGSEAATPVAKADRKEGKKLWDPMAPFSAYAKASERLLVRMRPEKLAEVDQAIEQIRKGPQGPKVIAAFDFDGTLVGGLTGAMLMQERMRRKEVTRAEILETAGVTFKAMAKLIEANEVVASSMKQWAGKTEEEMDELSGHLFETRVEEAIFPEMRRIIEAHREAGHTIVVATSASRYQVERAVTSLDIDNLICTQMEVEEGKLTGKLVGDSVFGPGKVAAIKKFIAEHGATLADTHFYADGDEEVGLMEAVGYPHPVNPGRRLSETARAKGWPVLRLQSRGSAKPANFVRNMAGLMTILPILQAGLAVGLLTRDKRQAANMIMPTWIQTQLDMAKVKLRVSGRKNLWARRPAVFVFNHRNNFDGSFVAALVRTDYVSIAKKDMAKNPVGRLVAAIMPTVFIDRGSGDPKKAAEALQPVVEAVDRGYSIMLSPEGTRTRGHLDSVGAFKKGAFHMAMAAGIPIVPVVIRNALDVAGRDAGAMRPGTVDIAVLPPVAIEDWTSENMNEKIEEVRQMFIETLNDWPEPDEDELE